MRLSCSITGTKPLKLELIELDKSRAPGILIPYDRSTRLVFEFTLSRSGLGIDV